MFKTCALIIFCSLPTILSAEDDRLTMPKKAKLAFSEDFSSGKIRPAVWYPLQKKWGNGNHGVISANTFIQKDKVNGKLQNVLVCRGHGDLYQGPLRGWQGNKQRVGGVLVTKEFFASGKYEVVIKIGSTEKSDKGPKTPTRPIGMIPAVWTYAYLNVPAGKSPADQFNKDNPMYNPHLNRKKWGANEYTSELDFPEFGKKQNLEKALYNTFLNQKHQTKTFPTKEVIDGKYHTLTTIWRTQLKPMPGIKDSQVTEYKGYFWIQDKAIPFDSYLGNPLKRLGKNKYALYAGKAVHHFIDGKFVGSNDKFIPCLSAQLNIGVWFPNWAGAAPWKESSMSVASVKIWQYDDEGDVKGIFTNDIGSNMDKNGKPRSRKK